MYSVLNAQGVFRLACGQLDQPVMVSFFHAYAGSGLVIHCLARFRRTPRRCKAVRTVSRLTRSGVTPSSPVQLKASMALRAVSVSQPNSAAIWYARLPLALARRIWQRRSTKAP